MSITKFPAAFATAFLAVPCALAQTETRRCQRTAQSALPLDETICCASSPSPFDMFPLSRLRAALFANS